MTREPTEAEIEALSAEAERGYCTEKTGPGRFCLRPAVAEIPDKLLLCARHVGNHSGEDVRMLA